jgi:hypothetical protein
LRLTIRRQRLLLIELLIAKGVGGGPPEIAGTSRPGGSVASELTELEELSEDSSIAGSTGGSRLELGVSVEPLSPTEESLEDDVPDLESSVVVEGAYEGADAQL